MGRKLRFTGLVIISFLFVLSVETLLRRAWSIRSIEEQSTIEEDINDGLDCFFNNDWSGDDWHENKTNTELSRNFRARTQQGAKGGKDEPEKETGYVWVFKSFVTVDMEELAGSEIDEEDDEEDEEKKIKDSNVN